MTDAPATTAKIKSIFTRKVGPLPVGLWVIGIGGGLAVAWYLRSHAAPPEDAELTDTAYMPPTDGTGGAATSEPYSGGGGGGTTDGGLDPYDPYGDVLDPLPPLEETPSDASDSDSAGGQAPVSTHKKPRNNNAWRIAAIDAAMAGPGGLSGLAASRAISRYLAGKRLTQRQKRAVNAALAAVGPPPQAVTHAPQGGGQGGQPGSNAAWRDDVVRMLTNGGWNHDQVATAIARFLAGKELTQAQRTIVERAIARHGAPPKTPPPAPHGASQNNVGAHQGVQTSSSARRDTGVHPATDTTRSPAATVRAQRAIQPAPPEPEHAPAPAVGGHRPDRPRGHQSPPRHPHGRGTR